MTYYFGLFLVRENGKRFTIVRPLQDFECPYVRTARVLTPSRFPLGMPCAYANTHRARCFRRWVARPNGGSSVIGRTGGERERGDAALCLVAPAVSVFACNLMAAVDFGTVTAGTSRWSEQTTRSTKSRYGMITFVPPENLKRCLAVSTYAMMIHLVAVLRGI